MNSLEFNLGLNFEMWLKQGKKCKMKKEKKVEVMKTRKVVKNNSASL